MSDRDALYRAICANPDDDTPRLVYADWLDEHGGREDRARAEFIRLQIDSLNRGYFMCSREPLRGDHENPFPPRCRCGPCSAARKERRILKSFGREWRWAALEPLASAFALGFGDAPASSLEPPSVAYYKGFAGILTSPTDCFVQTAGKLFASNPVVLVELSDSGPAVAGGDRCRYSRRTRDDQRGEYLPAALFDSLPTGAGTAIKCRVTERTADAVVYHSPGDACEALRVACITFGRRQRDLIWEAAARGS